MSESEPISVDIQVEAAMQLERQGGLDIIAINALVAALANGDRLLEAEEYLRKAVELVHQQGQHSSAQLPGIAYATASLR